MVKYNIPYYFNPEFKQFTDKYNTYIDSIYYTLGLTNIGDARYQTGYNKVPDVNLLPESNNIKQYIILNARFNNPVVYNKSDIRRLINIIEYYEATGIVFLDAYLLKVISKQSKSFAKYIDVIPSVNMFIDTYDKYTKTVEFIQSIGFEKSPSKIILDRSLNRNILSLIELSKSIRKDNIKVELLANEGCLYRCPYKINHDILIALTHFDNRNTVNSAENINPLFGCIDDYKHDFSKILKSPFIRPDDVYYYEEYIDTIKIAGRMKDPITMMDIIDAYIHRSYAKNLLVLNDSQGSLSEEYFIFNDLIPKQFVEIVTMCDKHCITCNYCNGLINNIYQKLQK